MNLLSLASSSTPKRPIFKFQGIITATYSTVTIITNPRITSQTIALAISSHSLCSPSIAHGFLYPIPAVRRTTMSGSTAAQNRLRGKTVLVTGASSGIGRATALEFARAAPNHGLRLILTARRLDRLHELADEITRETATGFKVEGKASGAVTQAVGSGEEKTAEMKSMSGVQVLPVQLDISRPEEIKEFVGRLPEEWRTVDVLVNNAYVFLIFFC